MGDHDICPECGGQSLQPALAGCKRPYYNHASKGSLNALLAEYDQLTAASAASGVPIEHDDLVILVDGLGDLPRETDDDGNARPSSTCGCGYNLIWVEGQWQHDAAEALWGGDHSTDGIEDPALNDAGRIQWDIEDGISKLVEARASELEDDSVYRDYGDDEYTLAVKVAQHGDRMLITTSTHQTTLDIDTVVERVIAT